VQESRLASAESIRVSQGSVKPTHARNWVVFFTIALSVLAYIDRVAISQVAPFIASDLHLNKTQMGTVFAAFILGYALFEIPGAWLADLLGPRKALLGIVSWWSVFTALTGSAASFRSLVAIRFSFGMGEAGCFPTITKALSTWLPARERTRIQGLLWTITHWSGAITPPLVVFMLGFVSWRTSFRLLGSLGILWLVPFALWYRDSPAQHKGVNQGELDLIAESARNNAGRHKVPWAAILRSRTIWLLSVQYYCLWFSGYFFITWLPTYLQEYHRLSPAKSAGYAAMTLFASGLGALCSGFLTGRLAEWIGDVARARRLMTSGGLIGAGTFLALSIRFADPRIMIALMCLAYFCHDLVMPPSWATCMDIGGRFSAFVSGVMNLFGNLAGVTSSALGGYLLQRTGGNWHLLIIVLSCVYIAGAFCWLGIDPVSPLAAEAESA
jgi:ACS family glucarate transporter-like MFS transporter